jgi:hypothetical protein
MPLSGPFLRVRRSVAVSKIRCQICKSKLEPVQELRYLVETQCLGEPAVLNDFRQLPDVNGHPLRVCKSCQQTIEADRVGFRKAVDEAQAKSRRQQRQRQSGVIAAFGVLAVGWFFASLLGTPRA